MARDRIEQLAIANLKRVLLKSKYVIPQILENDKTPSYDGDLLLYSTEDHAKSKIQGSGLITLILLISLIYTNY